MSSSIHSLPHFPTDSERIKEYLSKNLDTSVFGERENDVRQIISGVAASRFAGHEVIAGGLRMGVVHLISSFREGMNCVTGEILPNLGHLELTPTDWGKVVTALEKTLIECAKNNG